MIKPGCRIIAGMYGPAVCTGIAVTDWVDFRYKAIRCADNATIWVQNAVPLQDCTYVGPPDEESLTVCRLTGPYGEGLVRGSNPTSRP